MVPVTMRYLLLLLLLEGVWSVVMRHELTWTPSQRHRKLKAGKMKEYVKQHRSKVALWKRERKLKTAKQTLLDYGDFEYVANITLGTPPQQFVVVPDSGSANLWVASDLCQTLVCDIHSQFDANMSSTVSVSNNTFNLLYGKGSSSGIFATDIFRIGTINEPLLEIPNQTFGMATNISFDFLLDPADGIFGLGFPPIAIGYVTPPLQNALQQGLLSRGIFSVWFKRNGAQQGVPGGLITYGDIDTDHCSRGIRYYNLIEDVWWIIHTDTIGLAGTVVTRTFRTVVDTGTSLIGIPTPVLLLFAEAANANYSKADDTYYIDCNADPGPLTIRIGRTVFKIFAYNYIVSAGMGRCQLAFFANDQPSGGQNPNIILGAVFIRQFCVIHDIEKKRIGFATNIIG